MAQKSERPGTGLLAVDLCSDGRFCKKLYIQAGFRARPFISQTTVDDELWIPRMGDVFRQAVTLLPRSIARACAKAKVRVDQVEWLIAHQANERINQAVRERLGVAKSKVPSNIARYGNTSAATIPIWSTRCADGRLRPGQLVCFLALGAGIHWGSAIWRA